MAIQFNVKAVDASTGQLVTTPLVVRVDAGLSGTVRKTNPANFYAGPNLPGNGWIGDVEVIAAGYAPWTTGADPQVRIKDQTVEVVASLQPFRRPPCPAPVPRGILPPFPTPVDYRTTLPWTPPQSRDFLRADSWGVEMPGAPWVPGASTRFPERILSWFVDRYEPSFQRDYLCKYGGWYTHLKRSYDDSCGPVDNGPNSPPGNGQTLAQFVASCKDNKRYVKYVHVMLGSKYFSPWNMTLAQYQARFEPVIDALVAAKAVDEFCPGWEWDLWNPQTPGPITESIFKWVGQKAHAAGLSCWLHFSGHVTSWQTDGTDRFSFWDHLGTDVDGLNYQTQPEWSMKETQDRMVDTLWWFGIRGNIWKMRMDEDQASPEWNNFGPPSIPGLSYPEYANVRGYCACCTIDDVRHTDAKVWGFGNGGRMPDGSAI
jgi:hypothetical protein